MAQALRKPQRFSEAEYLDMETASDIRHELVDGIAYAMVGATDRHGIIAGNLFNALHNHLSDRCQPFAGNMRLRIHAGKAANHYFPDVLVSCDPRDRASLWREKPNFLAEVLSPSTERIDRTEKFAAYTNLASLDEYLLVAADVPRLELHRRRTSWQPEFFYLEDSVTLESVALPLPVAQLYRRVNIHRGD